jgi:hypothetical protein
MKQPELRTFASTDLFFEAGQANTVVDFIVDGLKQCESSVNRADLREGPGLLADQKMVRMMPGLRSWILWKRFDPSTPMHFGAFFRTTCTLFPAAEMAILDREYQPPRFWIVERKDHSSPAAIVPDSGTAEERELITELLSVARPGVTGLAAGDIDARVGACRARMLRRLRIR